ncbi:MULTISPECIES: hypothetical protein [unclassified Vibrio]|uniref:hypothetical protein n=1 Tax=unclassified Vibrio TaxID=2614977 RepID=UPI00159D3ECB|nr:MULTISPECIES: hypothetical protein [unclassified Vibrio]NVN82670.1 hypothetical protein [Vibrio sp. Scap16]QLE93205.1 hypothetical protein FLM53_09170 [Vibrio sp. Scap24]
MKVIGLVHSHEKAFFPESNAYRKYFKSKEDYRVEIFNSFDEASKESDCIIFYCGFLPFWKNCDAKLIMEYHSLSTGRWPRLKNLVKRILNKRADGYIFLNESTQTGFYFNSVSNYCYRSMGYSNYQVPKSLDSLEQKIVYMGTVNRQGVLSTIKKLAALGFELHIIGGELPEKIPNVITYPRMSQKDAYTIAASCTFGLNYTPDLYPYNIQDSTKLIDYCGLGMRVITNKYQWVYDFEIETNSCFYNVEDVITLSSFDEIDQLPYREGDYSKRAWEEVIDSSGVYRVVSEALKHN